MGVESVFWASVCSIFYTYLGYPLLLLIWSRVTGRTSRKANPAATAEWPSISIILAARNEAAHLRARLTNLLELSYTGRREVVVVSDGSTDATLDVVEPFGADVRLVELPPAGKSAALNAGVSIAAGEILVFADARQRFAPDALFELVANFADPEVGAVTGELVLDAELQTNDSTIGDGVGLYWKYEKWLRRKESIVWSTLGATGAIYAMRRRLWTPLPAATLLDDVLAPMRVVLGGHRIVFEENARAYDRTSPDAASEVRRKTRTLAGNYQILLQEPRLLAPWTNPVWLQYMSHKVGRLLVPWALVGALLGSIALASTSWFFAVALAAQIAFYSLAAAGAVLDARERTDASSVREHVPAVLQDR